MSLSSASGNGYDISMLDAQLVEHLKEDALDAAAVGAAIPTIFLARKVATLTKNAHGTCFKLDKVILTSAANEYKRILIVGAVLSAGAFFVGKEITRLISPDANSDKKSFVEQEQKRRQALALIR